MPAKVLVAEDNDDYRMVLRMLLSSIGCTVVEASNGLEAIKAAVSTHPDLIIMDLLMPQLGGLEATKRLSENLITRHIPVVVCTALSMEALGHRNLLNSPHEVIQKPVQLEKLRDIVRKYVPHESQPQKTSLTPDRKGSIDVVKAWRLLRKIKQTLNEDSLQVGFPEAHDFHLARRARRSH